MIRVFFSALIFSCMLNAMFSDTGSHLDIIIESVLHDLPAQFSEDDKSVFVLVAPQDAPEAKKRLADAFGSAEGFLCHYANRAGPTIDCPVVPARSFCELQINSKDDAITQVKNIFGDFFDDMDINETVFTKAGSQYADGHLVSGTYSNNYSHVLKAIRGALLSSFIERKVADLQRAFFEDDHFLKPQDNYTDGIDDLELVGLIRDSLRMIQLPEQKTCLSIDLKRIFDLSFPPTIEEETFDNSVRFTIEKAHLVLHLKQLILNKTLLRLVSDDNDVYCEPMFFTENIILAKPSLVVFVIDRSGSLKEEFNDLKDGLKKTISELWTKNKEAIIRLVFFSDEREVAGDFSFVECDALFSLIDAQNAAGRTRLLETVDEEIGRLVQEDWSKYYSVNLVIFTDGQNNLGRSDCDFLQATVRRAADKQQTLTAYTLGFGDECDKKILAGIAKATLGQNFHFKDMSSFLGLVVDAVDCEHERKLETVLLQLKDKAVFEAKTPVFQDRFGLYPSGLLFPRYEVEDAEALATTTAKPANESQLGRIQVSRAYFLAIELINSPSKSLHDLEAMITAYVEANNLLAAGLAEQFAQALRDLRNRLITPREARERIESAFGVYQ